MHEYLDTSTKEYLERSCGRCFSSEDGKAVICYLTLPCQTAEWDTRLDSGCGDSGYYYGRSATSMLIDCNSFHLIEEHRRRFARAMLRLGLRPSVHPSQLQKNLSAISTNSKSSSSKRAPLVTPSEGESRKEKEDAVTKRISDLEQSQWPKLMLLASQTISQP